MKYFVTIGRRVFFSMFLLFLLLSAAQAQIFTGAGFTIVDGAARVPASCSTVAVSGITTNVNVRSVSYNTFNHTWLGDLQMMVYPPGTAPPPSTTGAKVISSPPDDRACNFLGNYRFIDSGATTVDAATVGPCASATNLAPGDYRTSDYFGPSGAGSPPTSLTTLFGALTPAQANGNWLVCAFDFVSADGGSVGSVSLQLTVLSAASVSLGGRVVTSSGQGVSKANVTLTSATGAPRSLITSPFGYYRFDEVSAGETYTITVTKKGYEFDNPSVVIFAEENNDQINFTGNPQ